MSLPRQRRSLYGLSLFLAAAFVVAAETPPQFSWARRAGGAGDDEAAAVAVDPAGNVFVTGVFSGTSSIGNSNFVSSGFEDIFLAKYDTAGNFLWARQAGGTGDDYGLGVATDPAGNVYCAGSFQNTASFGPTTLTANGHGTTRPSDVFIAKYSSAGSLIWVRGAGGDGSDQANAIAVDALGNAYITGSFDADATFGVNSLVNGTGADDICVAKCSSAGDFLWARKAGDSDTNNIGTGIALDGATNVYVTGYFSGTATFGSTNLTGAGTNTLPDVFLAKYDAVGNLLWVRQAGGTGDDRGNAVAADAAGNVSIAGQFIGTAGFGNTNLAANGNGSDIFVARYNAAGNFLWARKAGGNNAIYGDAGFGIATDMSSNAFVTGYFSGTATFGASNLVSAGFQNVFCSGYDSAGNLLWVRGTGGTLNDFGSAVASDPQGNVFLAGFFTSSTVPFDSVTLTNSGGQDAFLVRLGAGVVIVPILNVASSNGQVVLSWPASANNFILESATNLPGLNWMIESAGTNLVGTNRVATLPAAAPQKFFRLRKQ